MLLRLPVPPSVNAMFATDFKTRRRFKTKGYNEWLREADKWLCPPLGPKHVETIDGPYQVEIRLPQKMRGDIDGRCKAALDFLVSRGVTPDDKFLQCLTVRRCPELDGDCWVEVTASHAEDRSAGRQGSDAMDGSTALASRGLVEREDAPS